MKNKKAAHLDPLYVIFEKYLYNFPDEDLDRFIETIVSEYLGYLDKHDVIVPSKRKVQLMKDLADEVYDIYIRKVHGCLNLQDYQNNGRVTKLEKLRANERYFKLTGS